MAQHRMMCWTGVAGSVAVLAAPLHTQDLTSTAKLQDGTLSFVAHATVGDFTGTTTRVTGAATAGPDAGSARGWVEAGVNTLQTGNGRRDRDMRAVLEADKYPTVRFELSGVTARGPLGPDSTPAVLHGTFALHGVTRPVDVPVAVVRRADTVRVAGHFPLDVTAYGVRGLSRMFGMLRVDAVVDVRLALHFVIVDPRTPTPTGTRP